MSIPSKSLILHLLEVAQNSRSTLINCWLNVIPRLPTVENVHFAVPFAIKDPTVVQSFTSPNPAQILCKLDESLNLPFLNALLTIQFPIPAWFSQTNSDGPTKCASWDHVYF